MPMFVQHIRPHPACKANPKSKCDGEELIEHRWGYWHLGCIIAGYEAENDFSEDHFTSYDEMHRYEFVKRHGYEDPEDGERMEILSGDYFTFSR